MIVCEESKRAVVLQLNASLGDETGQLERDWHTERLRGEPAAHLFTRTKYAKAHEEGNHRLVHRKAHTRRTRGGRIVPVKAHNATMNLRPRGFFKRGIQQGKAAGLERAQSHFQRLLVAI